MTKCSYCGGFLRSVGNRRKNGKPGKRDWDSRQFHTKCYNRITERHSLCEKYGFYYYYQLQFGKHKGKTLHEIYDIEKSYLQWMRTKPNLKRFHFCIDALDAIIEKREA